MIFIIKKQHGTSLAVRQFRLFHCWGRGTGLTPGQGTKILHAVTLPPKLIYNLHRMAKTLISTYTALIIFDPRSKTF